MDSEGQARRGEKKCWTGENFIWVRLECKVNKNSWQFGFQSAHKENRTTANFKGTLL